MHKISKMQLRNHIVNAHNELAVYAEQHPEIAPMLRTMLKKGEMLRKEHEKSQTATTEARYGKTEGKVESENRAIVLKLQDDKVQVLNLSNAKLHFWRVKAGLDRINGENTGRTYNAPGKVHHGTPVYKSTFDRKVKGQVLPSDKLDEIIAFLEEEGATIQMAS